MDVTPVQFTLIAGLVSFGVMTYQRRRELAHVPSIGKHTWFPIIDGYRFLQHAREMLEEGYSKYYGTLFKVPLPDRWIVLVTSPKLVDEFRLAREDELSFKEVSRVRFQTKYTVGEESNINPYHIHVLRSTLTRQLASTFSEVHDEIIHAFNYYIPITESEWAPIRVVPTIQRIVCQVSNRMFIGLPFCRDPDWLDLNLTFSTSVLKSAHLINMFPEWFKPVIGPLVSPLPAGLRRAKKHIQEIVAERLQMTEDMPQDLISWLIQSAQGPERDVDRIIKRVLLVNIAAIHTSATTFAQALFHLTTRTEYIQPLREEVAEVITREGWSKASINKMTKLDSFFKETLRYEGIGGVLMGRRVVSPRGYTFSDGTYLPFGTFVGVPTFAVHHDERVYPSDPFNFDGFRYYREQKNPTSGGMASSNLGYLPFGHGRHACPGRFFAALELKTMLAHVLLNYDMVIEGKPENRWFSAAIFADEKAKILFRRRVYTTAT